MKGMVFVCRVCGKKEKTGKREKEPRCCGRPMEPELAKCTSPFVAETARPDAADEPCDDGTKGKDR